MDIPLHSNQIDSWKNFSLWGKRCATKVFSSATSWPFSGEHLSFFQVAKRFGGHVIEYLLLAIEPINLFFAFMQYTRAKLEKVDQNIPLRSWTRIPGLC